MKTLISRFEKDGSGVTAIEYALIAFGVAGAITAVVISLGTELQETFGSISDAMNTKAVATEAAAAVPLGQQHTRNKDRAGREGSADRSFDKSSFDHDHFHH